MKVRGLLIGALLLAGLSGLLYWSNQAEKAKKNEPDPNAPPKIVDIKKDTITGIEIHQKDAPAVVLAKGDDGKWAIKAPKSYRADQNAVDSLATTISGLTSNRLVEDNATDLAPFGLDSPRLEVVAKQKGGGSIKILVGDETPTGSNFFAKRGDQPKIFTLASWNKTSMEKSAWDLRDKRLLTFDSDKLSRIELTAKGGTVEIGKNAHNEWQIVKPRPLRADGGNVEQLLSRLRDAKMDSSMSADDLKSAASKFSRAKRVAVAKVTDAAGTQRIEVRKTSDNQWYAKSSVVTGAYKITSTVGEGLDKGLADLRNKKLFDFGFSDPSRIEIRDGDKTAVYKKDGDKWMKDGVRMDSTTVRALIDELRDLSAESFPDSGFTTPSFEATVVSDKGKRTEKVLIAKNGKKYFAKREGEPSIYELKAVDADRLKAVAEDVKKHTEKPKDEKKDKS